jgi:hypothetical protein
MFTPSKLTYWLTALASLAPCASAQTVLYKLKGSTSPQDDFGIAVADAGDVDGDGSADILVTAPARTKPNGDQTGAAIVYSGATGQVLRTHLGAVHGERIGNSATKTGDLDGDGITDYAVGALEADWSAPDSGSVYCYSGGTGLLIRRIDGPTANGFMGASLCDLGDVDGDGVSDLAAGGISTSTLPGHVWVFSGALGTLLYSLQDPLVPIASFAMRVAGIGDADGDGRGDLAIGSPYANGAQGSVRIVSIAQSGHTTYLASAGGEFGTCVAAAGDVDGDGRGDVIASAPWEGPAGRVKVFSGASGAILRTFDGEAYGQRFGQTAVRCGDFDGDGVGEFAIGAIWASYTATNAGRIRVFSGQSGAVLYTFDGDNGRGDLGTSLAALGDVNGDGVGELVAGQPKTFPNSAKVFSGACSVPYGWTYCVGKPNSAGPGASISFTGTPSIAAANFTLTVAGCPPNKSGIFIYGSDEAQTPFGNGFLCVSGQVIRRIPPKLMTSSLGTASLPINFTSFPTNFLPGANPRFQFWYRDAPGGGQGVNTSNALSMTFCP